MRTSLHSEERQPDGQPSRSARRAGSPTAHVQHLQRVAGNAAVAKMVAQQRSRPSVQRYRILDPAASANDRYGMDSDAVFESQHIDHSGGGAAFVITSKSKKGQGTRDVERRRGDKRWEAATETTSADYPRLKLSEVGPDAMAVEDTGAEPRVMWATDSVKADSNTRLAAVGAEVRLEAEGGELKVPSGAGGNHRMKALRPASRNSDANDPSKLQILDRQPVVECNSFVKLILGDIGQRVARFPGGHEAEITPDEEPTKQVADQLVAGQQNPQQLAQAVTGKTAPDSDFLPPGYGAMNPATKAAGVTALGINEAAAPEVGEGFVIKSHRPMPDPLPYADYERHLGALSAGTPTHLTAKQQDALRKSWSIHFAGVVAKLGSDTITMENYNRHVQYRWELFDLYEQLLTSSARLRTTVQQMIAAHKVEADVNPIGDERLKWWRKVRQTWTTDLNNAVHALDADDKTIKTAFEKIEQAEKAGLMPDRNSLVHFKMYGAGAQSFHSQWEGSATDGITLRIGQSLAMGKSVVERVLLKRRRDFLDTTAPLDVDLVRRIQGLAPPDADLVDPVRAATDQASLNQAKDGGKKLMADVVKLTADRLIAAGLKTAGRKQSELTSDHMTDIAGDLTTWADNPRLKARLPWSRKTWRERAARLKRIATALNALHSQSY